MRYPGFKIDPVVGNVTALMMSATKTTDETFRGKVREQIVKLDGPDARIEKNQGGQK
jgi:hypothetical protein